MVRAIVLMAVLAVMSVGASDWPRWLGPANDNTAPEDAHFNPDLSKWKEAWHKNLGIGYSSVAVVGNQAFTMGHDGKAKETVYCLDASTGNELWKYSYDAPLMPLMHSGGPNATPTILGELVVTVSKDGQVLALTKDKGEKKWGASLQEVLGMKTPRWGFASSPVIDGNQVLFTAGKVAALDLATGKTLWTSKSAYHPGYASVVVFDFAGKKLLASFDGKGLSILNAADGAEVTRYPFKANYDMTATTPIVLNAGKRIFISSNSSSDMLDFDGAKLTQHWTSREIKNVMNNGIVLDGQLYCIDGSQQQPTTRLASFNLEDGKENWGQPSFGYGNTIGIGKTILALTELGDLVTVKAAPEKFTEISRRKVLEKVCWTTPVYANGRIYVRNDQGETVCLAPGN